MAAARPAVATRPAWQIVALFTFGYIAMQLAWIGARGTAIERWVIHDATVLTSVALINALSPEADAVAKGASVSSPGGGINVRNGCEGTELFIPLIVALFAYPFSGRARVVGVVLGTAFVFLLNQARLLALFYSFRNEPVLFGALHGIVGPLIVIVCLLAFLASLLAWDRRVRA